MMYSPPDLSAQPVNTLDDLRERFESRKEDSSLDELILIMGAGNIIMGDEGIGPVALDYLHKRYDFPDNVALLDVATTGISMLPNLEGMDHLIIIDAANDSGHPPGTVIFYTPEDLANQQVMHSAHDQRLTDVLFAAQLTGIELKSVVVVGVQVQTLEHFVLELSEPVQAAIPIACAATLHCLSELGYTATAKSDVEPDPILLDALENYAPEDS
ncbi:MAG: hydrogenase maturation protease [Coriobacteriia bacterium]|nr:hydrogenase maturation protease [Coriobacteriia bacterium]